MKYPVGYKFLKDNIEHTIIAGPDEFGDYGVEWYFVGQRCVSYFWNAIDIQYFEVKQNSRPHYG